jgi:transposase
MEAFSRSVRRRIVELYQSGLDTEDVAQIMACSQSGARRIWQRYREEGRVGPRPHAGGWEPKLGDEQKKQVLGELIRERPDAFCRELVDELASRVGVRVCRQTIGRWLDELGVTRKKSRCTPASKSGSTSRPHASSGSTRLRTAAAATSRA